MKIYSLNLENLKLLDTNQKSADIILKELPAGVFYEELLEELEDLMSEDGNYATLVDEDSLMTEVEEQLKDILDEALSAIDYDKDFKDYNDKAKKIVIDDIMKRVDCIASEYLSSDEIELVDYNESSLDESKIISAVTESLEICKAMYDREIIDQLADIIDSDNFIIKYDNYSLRMPRLGQYSLMSLLDKADYDIKVIRKY